MEHVFEGGCVVRDGVARPVWFGAALPPAAIVQRILTPFFDEI